MVAVTTPSRATRREICRKHGVDFGQEFIQGIPGQRESFWIGACRECEDEIRREQQAAEELAKQTEEITAETERRIAADSQFEERVRELAAADLAEAVGQVVASYCALHRPEWEEYHRDLEWNRIVREIQAERSAAIISRLEEEEE